MSVATVLQQIIVIFLLMAIGYVVTKTKILSSNTTREITAFLIAVVLPCVILKAFMKPYDSSEAAPFWWSMLLNSGYFIILIGLSKILFPKRRFSDKVKRMQLEYSLVYSNNGFMGLPLLMALFGSSVAFYAGAQVAIGNAFMWSHGVGIFKKARGEQISLISVITHPNIVALIVAMFIYFGQIPVPHILSTTIGFVAQINTPLSMMIVGSSIAQINFKGLFTNKELWGITILRNLLAPAIVIGILLLVQPYLQLPLMAIMVIIIMAACPVAAMVTMMSKLYDFDEEFPTKAISLSTIVSLGTLPFIILISLYFFGG